MKDNKSPGVDGIPPKLLKEIVEQISTLLAKLFNLSLEEQDKTRQDLPSKPKAQMASGQGSHWLIESPTMFIYL